MTRCSEFYERWEREPNWCEKCPEQARLIDKYLDFVKELESMGVPKKATKVGISESAARPLFKLKSGVLRDEMMKWVADRLTNYSYSTLERNDVLEELRDKTEQFAYTHQQYEHKLSVEARKSKHLSESAEVAVLEIELTLNRGRVLKQFVDYLKGVFVLTLDLPEKERNERLAELRGCAQMIERFITQIEARQ